MKKQERKPPLTKAKTASEIRHMKRAIGITEKVFRELDSPFGRSEHDVAREINKLISGFGCRLSFRPIVASGSTVIHHKPGKKIIRESRPLIIDLGVKYMGYCSDITRMYVPGDKRIRRIYEYVLKIQKEVIRKAMPGVEFKELHGIYEKMMKRRGYKVRHGIGHGIGLHVHERVGTLKAGMVITIEPGIYIKGLGGFRIEDMMLVRKGKTELLSGSIPKQLF